MDKDLRRWVLQFVMIVLAVPVGAFSLAILVGVIEYHNTPKILKVFLSNHAIAVALSPYYFLSIYIHYCADKNIKFDDPFYSDWRFLITVIPAGFFIILSILSQIDKMTFLLWQVPWSIFFTAWISGLIVRLRQKRHAAP
jgi:hypothetical protein